MGSVEEEYRDFRCYEVLDDGEYNEIDLPVNEVESLLSSEGVYLFVRYDIRRIFIWKGPRSPVRKRFISSRVGSKIQESCSKTGMHLKIVSVDAGDEPREFLKIFGLKSYEVKEDELPEDMYYIRNEERRKLEDEARLALEGGTAALDNEEEKPKKKSEYTSPVLHENDRLEKMEAAKKKAVTTAQEITYSLASDDKPKSFHKPLKRRHMRETPTGSYSHTSSKTEEQIMEQEKTILNQILSSKIPQGQKRLNIIIGNSLYGPKRVISTLFGKEVEEERWDKVGTIPNGNIDIETASVRAYCNENEIKGLEIFSFDQGDSGNSGSAEKSQDSSQKGRKLNPIPQGD